ncbi:MAG: hypothetical protein JSV97_04575 [candidate division WOR-3 bacterium]|nr:MAG: hypothetical protein JSV97_04575 [candidate division WOR-3 bacterium]
MNPIIQIIIAIASSVSTAMLAYIAWLGYRHNKKVKLSSIYTALVQQANIVNSEIGQYGIGGPYTTLLNIPKNEYKEFGYYATIFFHHLRLLSIVFQNGINQKLMIMQDVDRYISWAKTVLKPWINSNAHLSKLLDKVISQKDLYGENFLEWIRKLMK